MVEFNGSAARSVQARWAVVPDKGPSPSWLGKSGRALRQ